MLRSTSVRVAVLTTPLISASCLPAAPPLSRASPSPVAAADPTPAPIDASTPSPSPSLRGSVFLIVMENNPAATALNPRLAPYTAALPRRFGLAPNYRATTHPSLPNHL